MSDPQRPEREAIERQLREEAAFWKSRRYGDQGLRESAERAVRIMTEAADVLAALPPTPPPGVAELLERIADLERQLAWERKRGDYLRGRATSAEFREGARLPMIADPDVPPAPTGERE
jgi:hypothetical protein